MGDEISTASFKPADFSRFEARLRQETSIAHDMFENGAFSQSGYSLGFEIEAWLVDHAYVPNPVNEAFLRAVRHPLVVPELSRFNVELNCTPAAIEGAVFSGMAEELTELWQQCERVAHGLDANIVMIGTLPVIRDDDLGLQNISPLKRYCALNHEVLRRRGGRAIRVAIIGRDSLVSEHRDVMLEAAATSFQIHLKTPASLAHLYWNASAVVSGPLIAASGNAPFLFGKDLWSETRIPLFEQAVDLPGSKGVQRVSFGDSYLRHSLFEIFAENLATYPVLLPITFEEPATALRHLSLHNGTIWRWNRPLVGVEADGTAHLRIEHRILPAGPSMVDMMANTAFYVGLVHELVALGVAEAPELSFADAKKNFYAGARFGLAAEMQWPGIGRTQAQQLLLERLVPMARAGLVRLRIAEDGDGFLDLFEHRVRSARTGADWQRRCLAANAGDFREMMAAYCERQRSGAPVSQWPL